MLLGLDTTDLDTVNYQLGGDEHDQAQISSFVDFPAIASAD